MPNKKKRTVQNHEIIEPEVDWNNWDNEDWYIFKENPSSYATLPKNMILYGPPGTGKTYHTVLYAVAVIEEKSLSEVASEPYEDIAKRYHHYKENGLIEFTTFHQSYSYEDFIEGIRPVMNNDSDDVISDIQYEVSLVFLRIL